MNPVIQFDIICHVSPNVVTQTIVIFRYFIGLNNTPRQ